MHEGNFQGMMRYYDQQIEYFEEEIAQRDAAMMAKPAADATKATWQEYLGMRQRRRYAITQRDIMASRREALVKSHPQAQQLVEEREL